MVVSLKELLDARPLQFGLVLDHGLRIGILPLTIRVFGVEVIFVARGHERRLHPLLVQRLPVETLEPAVLLKNLGAFLTQAITWLTLQKFVDEISCFDRPAVRDI